MKPSRNSGGVFLIATFFVSILIGCSKPTESIPTLTPTLVSKTIAPTLTATQTPTVMPTTTPEPTPTKTLTPTPLSNEQVQAWISSLVENNGGCKLPCWWGITPGQTTWDEAEAFLKPYSSQIDVLGSGDRFIAGVFFFFPPPELTEGLLYLGFDVRANKIDSFAVIGIAGLSAYRLPELLDTYGEPEGVWVNAYSGSANDYGPRHVSIHVYYQAQGIFAQYTSLQGEVDHGTIRNCFESGPALTLLDPKQGYGYQDVMEDSSLDFQFPFLPVEEALEMDTGTFYQTYRGTNREVCLETPVELWRWGVPSPTP